MASFNWHRKFLFLFFAFFKTFDNIPSDQSLKYVIATTKKKDET